MKAAVFTKVDMKAVMTVGAPSYTSGTQKWNGAADTLKARPIIKKVIPTNTMKTMLGFWNVIKRLLLISDKLNEPVAPYNRAIPNSRIPLAKAPMIKYFKEDSLEAKFFLSEPARMNIG